MQRNYFQALSAIRRSLSLIFPRCTENFRMITCINLAVVWVSLSRRYVQTLCWCTDCTCENLDYAVIENRLISNVQDICHLRYFVR